MAVVLAGLLSGLAVQVPRAAEPQFLSIVSPCTLSDLRTGTRDAPSDVASQQERDPAHRGEDWLVQVPDGVPAEEPLLVALASGLDLLLAGNHAQYIAKLPKPSPKVSNGSGATAALPPRAAREQSSSKKPRSMSLSRIIIPGNRMA